MYTIFYKRFIDYYVIFEICLMASKSARMRGSAHLKAVTVAQQKSYVISSVFCENSAGHDETATRLYLPIRAGRLHEVCTNDFYLLTHYVRSQKRSLVLRFKGPRNHSETWP